MKATLTLDETSVTIDLSQPLDISLPLDANNGNPSAWYLDGPTIQPVSTTDWVGLVAEGAPVNFNTIQFNPHAHGTHTECVGHIAEEIHSVNTALTAFFFTAEVLSIEPEIKDDDAVITKEQLQKKWRDTSPQALVIRTLPNKEEKRLKNYDHSNWPYLLEEAAQFIREQGIEHLLVDMPSVDKEKDGGRLLAHHAFWHYPEDTRMQATITEFIYVGDHIQDGSYVLNLQVAPFENDAAPSRPVLYKIH